MPTFELICLANSKKHGGRCVAGVRTDGQGWIRLVGPAEDGALQPHHYRLQDGSEARVLDVLRLSCRTAAPKPHHPEDWSIGGATWRLVARPADAERQALLRAHVAAGSPLLGNWSDRVPYDAFTIKPAAASLALVAPQEVAWIVKLNDKGERRMRVAFTLAKVRYDLALTDPQWEIRLNRLPLGVYSHEQVGLRPDDEVFFTISLSEPFQASPISDACCYKLVAAVIVLPPQEPFKRSYAPVPGRAVVSTSRRSAASDLSDYPDPFPQFQGNEST